MHRACFTVPILRPVLIITLIFALLCRFHRHVCDRGLAALAHREDARVQYELVCLGPPSQHIHDGRPLLSGYRDLVPARSSTLFLLQLYRDGNNGHALDGYRRQMRLQRALGCPVHHPHSEFRDDVHARKQRWGDRRAQYRPRRSRSLQLSGVAPHPALGIHSDPIGLSGPQRVAAETTGSM